MPHHKKRLMRAALAILTAALAPFAAAAQTAQDDAPARYGRAPWWMSQPIIASTGVVEAEILANHASFSATFQAVGKTAPEATKAAVDKVRELGKALSAYDPAKVTVQTTFRTRPIFAQYRDKEGNLVDNERADRIEGYEANAEIALELRDVGLVERVYATVMAARPSSADQVDFALEPDDSTLTQLYGMAVADAARRARLSVEASGARLGPVKLIDPTGRACQTDVMVEGAAAYSPNPITFNVGSFPDGDLSKSPSSPFGAPSSASVTPGQFPLQPPLSSLRSTACVVYSLAG